MADVHIIPRIRCDNCGFTDEKELEPFGKGAYRNKEGWGGIKIAPTHRGNYPNNIAFVDLCPDCLTAVHDAVAAALSNARDFRARRATGGKDG